CSPHAYDYDGDWFAYW
nr:immunoglobulin heavy chain junction region [Mus musculus]NSM05298.1 immunoglobulin heavy chain junction region [Mus musculus]NSM07676.1 immunoglobulin heavy chain junction region [Mus musculus]